MESLDGATLNCIKETNRNINFKCKYCMCTQIFTEFMAFSMPKQFLDSLNWLLSLLVLDMTCARSEAKHYTKIDKVFPTILWACQLFRKVSGINHSMAVPTVCAL